MFDTVALFTTADGAWYKSMSISLIQKSRYGYLSVSQFVGIGKRLTGWGFFILRGLWVMRKQIKVSNRSFRDGRSLSGILWPNVPDP